MEEQIKQFLNFMAVEKGSAANTISAYRNDLDQFQQFVHTTGGNGSTGSWARVDQPLLQQYIGSLRARDYADATVARKVAAVKSFFNYLSEYWSHRIPLVLFGNG